MEEPNKFRKLAALRDRIRGDTPTATVTSFSASDHPRSHILRLISYGEEAVNFCRTYTEVQRFNTIMRGIYDSQATATESQMRQVFYQQNECDSREDEIAAREIYQAQTLSDIAKTVFRLLTQGPGCGARHTGLIHLTGFTRPEIDMILSVCGPSNKERWHLVSWSKRDQRTQSSYPTSPPKSMAICSALKSSWRHKKTLRIRLHQNGDWDTGAVSTDDRMECNIRLPKLTLKDLLHRARDEQSGQPFVRLLKEDKLDLAVAIARSLLYLLGSPLLGDAWEAENIYVEQATGKSYGNGSGNKPFIRHDMKELSEDMPGYPDNRRSFVLKLGVLLWELLFGHRISVTTEDEEDEDEEDPDFSLFNALNREEINARETFVEKPFLDIIANCLNVYSQEQLDDPAFRSDIYWKIVKPLQDYQKAFQSTGLTRALDQKRLTSHLQTQCQTQARMTPTIRSLTIGSPPKRPSSPSYSQRKRMRYDNFSNDAHLDDGTSQGSGTSCATCGEWSSLESSNTGRFAHVHHDGQDIHPSTAEDNRWFASPVAEPAQSKQSTGKPLTLGHYSVGILCALPKELLPIRILFDSKHNNPGVPSQDTNSYSFGRIGKHNVVATCLPSGQYGSNSAAHVISHMIRSFPAMKFCLLVGIGAGIPTPENDIRLGDVVVSHPTGTRSGVIQHDQLKVFDNKNSQLTGFLRGPPSSLLRDISNLMSNPDLSPQPLQEYINDIVARRPEYKHPGAEHDRLFKADYIHDAGNKTCEHCTGDEVVREPRAGTHPRIHYGLIASGNQVMKSAQARDDLGSKYNVLCFEMEAAGVMNAFDCLVIRGICDYADSHKNDLWQNYASAAAAAYAKLLLTVRSSDEGVSAVCLMTSPQQM